MDDYTKRKNTESEENDTHYAGLGSEIFIVPREHLLNESDGSIKDGWEKYAVCLDVSDKKNAVTSYSIFENDGTAALKMRSHFSFDAELIDPLRDACVLTKCVLPYRSTIPFCRAIYVPFIHGPDAMKLKKPWCHYHLPEIQAHFITYSSGEVLVWFIMESGDIGAMSYQEYRNCLSYEKWKEDSIPVNSSRYRIPYPNIAAQISKIGKAFEADTPCSVGMQMQIFLDNYYHKSHEIIDSIGKLWKRKY
nr:MAG TPA: hypothetical protein [Caudoviricetes sp.]